MDIKIKRQNLFESIIENETKVRLINGKNKGKSGIVIKIGQLRNCNYGRYHQHYHNYFQPYVQIKNRIVSTSCDYIKII
jgi:ribosomal protein L24